jgi:hypothetical protein
MGAYKAKLTVPGVFEAPLAVEIDLNEGRMAISTVTGEIGAWDIDDIEVLGRDNGFELRAEGDVILFSTVDDGRFAREVGLQWAPPRLRRLMAADLSESKMSPEEPPVRVFRASAGLRERFGASIEGAVDATVDQADGAADSDVSNVQAGADTAPRKRKGRHQRRGKGRHLRPVAG